MCPPSTLGGQDIATNAQTTFTADYELQPRVGGLSLMDTIHVTGTENGDTVDRTLTSTINAAPRVGAT